MVMHVFASKWHGVCPHRHVFARLVSFLFSPLPLSCLMDYNIFREELATELPAYGHALWELSPRGRYTAAEIGDVQLVSFARAISTAAYYNNLLPEGHPLASRSPQDGVPQRHEPLLLRSRPLLILAYSSPINFARSLG